VRKGHAWQCGACILLCCLRVVRGDFRQFFGKIPSRGTCRTIADTVRQLERAVSSVRKQEISLRRSSPHCCVACACRVGRALWERQGGNGGPVTWPSGTPGRRGGNFQKELNPDKADAAPLSPAPERTDCVGSSAAAGYTVLKQNMIVVHEVAQGDGFKNSVQRRLQAFPCLAHFTGIKA